MFIESPFSGLKTKDEMVGLDLSDLTLEELVQQDSSIRTFEGNNVLYDSAKVWTLLQKHPAIIEYHEQQGSYNSNTDPYNADTMSYENIISNWRNRYCGRPQYASNHIPQGRSC